MHTPGPWAYHNVKGHREILDGGGAPLVKLSGFATIEDARLIAAAPELLEALRAAEARLENSIEGGKMWEAALNKIKAAIARAEGRDA